MADYYTTKEVAEKLGYEVETVEKWARSGKQPDGMTVQKIGGQWRWKKSDVDRVLGVNCGE